MGVIGASLLGHQIGYLSTEGLNQRLQHRDDAVATCSIFYATLLRRWQSWQVYPVR